MKVFITILFSLFSFSSISAQDLSSDLNSQEEKMMKTISKMIVSENSEERNDLNLVLLQDLKETLLMVGAMQYPFEKIEIWSDLKSPLNDFRVISWELEDSEGRNQYYSAFLYSQNSDTLVAVHTSLSADLTTQQTDKEAPYPAIYFAISRIKDKRSNHIVLLGINRNALLTKTKVIESISIEDGLKFNFPVFEEKKKFDGRMIYTYSSKADMTIQFENDGESIVMDHLSPEKPVYEGKFEYYGPDFSFDAWHYEKGSWKYEADFDARMDKNLKDRYYEMKLPKQEKIY